jgi:hypothetical protein
MEFASTPMHYRISAHKSTRGIACVGVARRIDQIDAAALETVAAGLYSRL